MMPKVDVTIVGGGPSGISTALALRTYSDLSVTIIERSDLSGVRIGEHVSAGIFELLEYLKLSREDFCGDCFTPSYGTTSFWGSGQAVERDAIFTSEESSYQLYREEFDFTLIEKLIERGGRFIPRSRVSSFSRRANGEWTLSLSHAKHGNSTITTKFLVDASGRNSSICSHLGADVRKLDQLVGIGSLFNPPLNHVPEKRLTIESVPDGWWYVASLHGGQIAAVLFTDADIASQKQLNRNENWLRSLSQTSHSRRLLSGSQATRQKPWVRNAFSRIPNDTNQPNVLAVGEAACAFDPISSIGIGFAMSSGCHAARLIRAHLESPGRNLLKDYHSDLERHFSEYRTQREQIYRQEARWPKETFWRRRQELPA